MEDKKIIDEPQYIKIIPPFHKGVQLPENLKWITINPKPHKLNENMLTLEIEALEDNLQKLTEELSHLRKRKHKEVSNIEGDLKENEAKSERKELKENSFLDQEPRKKYQKTKRVCPCCNVIVIRHFCPHTSCEHDCPIKMAYLKKKIKLDSSKT